MQYKHGYHNVHTQKNQFRFFAGKEENPIHLHTSIGAVSDFQLIEAKDVS